MGKRANEENRSFDYFFIRVKSAHRAIALREGGEEIFGKANSCGRSRIRPSYKPGV